MNLLSRQNISIRFNNEYIRINQSYTWPSGVFVRLVIESGDCSRERGKGGDVCWYYKSMNSSRPDETNYSRVKMVKMAVWHLHNYPTMIDNTNGTIVGGGGGVLVCNVLVMMLI